MKSLFAACATILFFLQSYSQTSEQSVKWGPEFKLNRMSSMTGLIYADDSGYCIRIKKESDGYSSTKVLLANFDSEMAPLNKKVIDPDYDKKSLDIEYISLIEDRLWVFGSNRDWKTKDRRLAVQEIDKQSLELIGKSRLLESIPKEKKGGDIEYSFRKSPNRKMLLTFVSSPEEKDGNESFRFKIYDAEMKLLREQEVQLNYNARNYSLNSIRLEDNGDFYLLGSNSQSKDDSKSRYAIMRFSADGKREEFELPTAQRALRDYKFKTLDNRDIIVTGFYSSKPNLPVSGAFYILIDGTTGNVLQEDFSEFSLDFLTQYMTDTDEGIVARRVEKGKPLNLFNYYLDEVIRRDDGRTILVGEQFYFRQSTITTRENGVSSIRFKEYYYFMDLLVISVSPEGKIEWNRKIPKYQISLNDEGFYSSYAMFDKGNELVFIFNDHADNLDYKEGDELKNFSKRINKATVVMATIDSEGNQDKKSLFPASEVEVMTRPAACKQIDQSNMLIFGKWRKKRKFGLLNIQ